MLAPIPAVVVLMLAVQSGAHATITGRIRDGGTGGAVAGAEVTLTDLGRTVASGPDGGYRLESVPAGPQHLTVRSVGYAERTLHALVPAGGTLEVHVVLDPAPIPVAGLHVRPPVAVRGLDVSPLPGAGEPGERTLTLAAIRNHPLLSEPDALLAFAGGDVAANPESPEGLHILGGASDQTAYTLDGVPVLSPFHVAGTFGAWNPDALASVSLVASTPSPARPHALSGVVAAETRRAGASLEGMGGVSTTQARASLAGPVGGLPATFLVSVRGGFPGYVAPPDEASYLGSEASDVIATVRGSLLGGELALLGYGSDTEVDAAAVLDAGPDATSRHAFRWRGRSLGIGWRGDVPGGDLQLRAWRASADASARWMAEGAVPTDVLSRRREGGVLVQLHRERGVVEEGGGLRLEEITTRYGAVAGGSAAEPPSERRLPMVVAFANQARSLAPGVRVSVAASVTGAGGRLYPAPSARVDWEATPAWTVSGAYARSHQFAQSLRNEESLVGAIFPADLWTLAGSEGVAPAFDDRGVVTVEHRPGPGMRIALEGWLRASRGLALVAPGTGEPFADSAATSGRGAGRGLALEASLSRARTGAVLGYGFQRVRLRGGGMEYTPAHAARHRLEAGFTAFPSATSSVRVGMTALAGRRGTPLVDGLEWEACNALDRGCEFGGAPTHRPDALGSVRLPPYARVDVGVRKHWHVAVAGRPAFLELHGTLTNLGGRANVLAWAVDPGTGERVAMTMRPLAPLVVGLDWRF